MSGNRKNEKKKARDLNSGRPGSRKRKSHNSHTKKKGNGNKKKGPRVWDNVNKKNGGTHQN